MAHKAPHLFRGIILESTFTSISDMVDALFGWAYLLKPFFLKMKWDSAALVPNLCMPILYTSGDLDEICPHK